MIRRAFRSRRPASPSGRKPEIRGAPAMGGEPAKERATAAPAETACATPRSLAAVEAAAGNIIVTAAKIMLTLFVGFITIKTYFGIDTFKR